MKLSQTNSQPKFKKRFQNPNHLFVTQDESSFCVDSNRSKCWAIKGSKPIKFTSGSKAKINIGGFYTENREFYFSRIPRQLAAGMENFPSNRCKITDFISLITFVLLMELRYANHCVYKIRYHMVFCVKYRKKLLFDTELVTFLKNGHNTKIQL